MTCFEPYSRTKVITSEFLSLGLKRPYNLHSKSLEIWKPPYCKDVTLAKWEEELPHGDTLQQPSLQPVLRSGYMRQISLDHAAPAKPSNTCSLSNDPTRKWNNCLHWLTNNIVKNNNSLLFEVTKFWAALFFVIVVQRHA